jgi:hypothetical protein
MVAAGGRAAEAVGATATPAVGLGVDTVDPQAAAASASASADVTIRITRDASYGSDDAPPAPVRQDRPRMSLHLAQSSGHTTRTRPDLALRGETTVDASGGGPAVEPICYGDIPPVIIADTYLDNTIVMVLAYDVPGSPIPPGPKQEVDVMTLTRRPSPFGEASNP